ncbi:hypothetical protein P3S67_005834 [Capsicum chacoense]
MGLPSAVYISCVVYERLHNEGFTKCAQSAYHRVLTQRAEAVADYLFRSQPIDRSYYAFGVPGTFHCRLFPSQSIHFAHCSTAIHWLSKCPEELLDEISPAWNKVMIHYAGTSNVEVLNAYVAQFEKDMEMFLNARAEEIVEGGMLVIISREFQ